MAKLLHKAEQQGILDVYLVRVTHHEWLQIPQDRLGYPKCSRETDSEVTDSKTSIKDWRRLDGSKLAWKQELLRKQRVDCILQVACWSPRDVPSVASACTVHAWNCQDCPPVQLSIVAITP